jgi:hypothetical protein
VIQIQVDPKEEKVKADPRQPFADSGFYLREDELENSSLMELLAELKTLGLPQDTSAESTKVEQPIQTIELNKSRAMVRESKLPPDGGTIELLKGTPPPRDFVWQGMIAGKVYVLAGFGGAGKTQLALQAAIEIAMCKTLSGETITQGAVLAVLGEEDKAEISRRISATVNYFKLEKYEQELLDHIQVFGMVGKDIRITAPSIKALEPTQFVSDITNAVNYTAVLSDKPVRLIILDHLGLLHGGDFNDRAHASMTMRVANHIAQETGAAVLLLAHTPKSAAKNEESSAQDVAGSTAFVDQARGAFVLAPMRESDAKHYGIAKDAMKNYVGLTTVKNNYGASGVVSWFIRAYATGYGVGVLAPVTLAPFVKPTMSNNAIEARLFSFIAEHKGQFSPTKVRDTYFGADGPIKASKREIEMALDSMLKSNKLISREPTPTERNSFGLGKQVKQVLDVPNE